MHQHRRFCKHVVPVSKYTVPVVQYYTGLFQIIQERKRVLPTYLEYIGKWVYSLIIYFKNLLVESALIRWYVSGGTLRSPLSQQRVIPGIFQLSQKYYPQSIFYPHPPSRREEFKMGQPYWVPKQSGWMVKMGVVPLYNNQ